jgi:3-hydroxyisobutyrate dehydrogenase-like beta-hydroxyacid dehydrogenase
VTVRVGVIGAGRMGLPICARLAGAGYALAATDSEPQRAGDVHAAGARWVPDTAGLIDEADVVLTVLPGAAEVQAVMGAAMARLRPGTAWIDMTSGDPRAARALALEAAARGIEALDAALGGGVSAAQSGTLQLFVGGEAAAVERHRPLLESLGRVEHVGGPGAGQLVKLIVNLLWFGQSLAVGEVMLAARRSGLDLDVLSGVLARSAAGSDFIRRDLAGVLAGDNERASFGLDRCCDQLDTVTDIAGELDVPFELSATVRDAYRAALAHYGPVDGELLPLVRLLGSR